MPNMKRGKRKRLEAAGWRLGDAKEFLGLTDDESALLDTTRAVRNPHMRTIAISIDEPTLKQLDELAAASARPRSRSALVRIAVREFAEREQRRETESQESEIIRKHRRRLAQQARALVGAQAKP